jgi:gamma-glutamyltranspeptidase/glutathione hydrolase
MHGGSDPEFVYVEPGASRRSVQTLVGLGYEAVPAQRLGRVNAIACPAGLQSSPETCAAATDPRGFGLAASTE